MKQNLKRAAFAIGIIALGITGCKKEMMNLNPSTNDFTESEIQSLVLQTEHENANPDVVYDEYTGLMTSANEGIASDYLVNAEDLDADENSSNPLLQKRSGVRNGSFIRCLKHVKLDSDQVRKARIVLGDYEDCKASAIKRARAIYHDLQEKYKELAEEQAKLLRAGKITKKEYEERIARLRKAFQKDLRALQLDEKLDAALKDCHTKLLRQLHGILSDRQWKAFISCYRK